jgi:hypothetical protein
VQCDDPSQDLSRPIRILGAGQYLTDIHIAEVETIWPVLVMEQKHTTTLISATDTLGQEILLLAEVIDFGFQAAYRDNIIAYQNKGKLKVYRLEVLTDKPVQRLHGSMNCYMSHS